MILNKTREIDLIQVGDEMDSTQMGIDPDSTDILMDFLSKNIYSDYEGSTIRELVSNAYDSHIATNCTEPILVKLAKNTEENWEFTVEDFGLGMNQYIIDTVIKLYLKSTKRDCNKSIGQKGLGFKVPLSYTEGSPFSFIGRKDGIESKWLMYESPEGNRIDTIYTRETTERNGVKIIVPIKNRYDLSTFSSKIKEQLCYFKGIYVINEYTNYNNDAQIFESDLFSWSENSIDSNLHVTLGQVYYPLDFKKLGISEIRIPIAIKISLDDKIEPTLSRESLTYTPFAKEFLLEKIKEIAAYFVNKYNETTHYQTFKEAKDFIASSDHYVNLCDKSFLINQLEQYSDVKPNEITIEGIAHLNLKNFKRNIRENLKQYYTIGYVDDYGVWKKEKLYNYDILRQYESNDEIIVINEIIAHKLKTFLRDKNSYKAYYVFDKQFKRNLKNKIVKYVDGNLVLDENSKIIEEETKYIDKLVYDNLSYHSILQLEKYPKSEWRTVISEYKMLMKEITDSFIIQKNVAESKEFIQWAEDLKEERRQERSEKRENGEYVSKAINKEKGEITIALFGHNKYKTALKKEVFTKSISKLNGVHKLTVYFDKKNDTIPFSLYDYFKTFGSTIDFVVLNTTEIKHVENLHQFITFKQFKMSKPFARLATSILCNNLLDSTPTDDLEVINECFPKYQELYDKIRNYKIENYSNPTSYIEKIIIEEVTESGNWDQNIYPELMDYKKIISKFGFLNYMQDVSNWRTSEEEKAIIKNMVYIMYKNNKINNEMVENMVLVKKSDLCIDGLNSENEVQITQSLAQEAGIEI